jgi:glutaredoxin-like protein NrdH
MALNRKNILFKEFDIDDNPEKLKFFKTLGFTSSPVVETDTDTWCGFQPDKINNI